MTVYLVIGGAAVVMLAMIVWLHTQQQAAIERLDDRIAHLMAGVSLLTDTTETGLRDVAMEIGRLFVCVVSTLRVPVPVTVIGLAPAPRIPALLPTRNVPLSMLIACVSP